MRPVLRDPRPYFTDLPSSTECRYLRYSFTDQERFAATTRGHWGIENQRRRVLDMQFGGEPTRGNGSPRQGRPVTPALRAGLPTTPYTQEEINIKIGKKPHRPIAIRSELWK